PWSQPAISPNATPKVIATAMKNVDATAASRKPTTWAWPGRDAKKSIANRPTITPIVAAQPVNVTSSIPLVPSGPSARHRPVAGHRRLGKDAPRPATRRRASPLPARVRGGSGAAMTAGDTAATPRAGPAGGVSLKRAITRPLL